MAREVKILKSLRDLSVKERVMIKGNLDTKKINSILKTEQVLDINNITDIVILHVHNDEAPDGSDKDYDTVILSDGVSYYNTSSQATINTLSDLLDEEDLKEIEDFGLHFYKQPSKNNEGDIILCNIF